jgi:hypothetical protein
MNMKMNIFFCSINIQFAAPPFCSLKKDGFFMMPEINLTSLKSRIRLICEFLIEPAGRFHRFVFDI